MKQKTLFIVIEGLEYGEKQTFGKEQWTHALRNSQKVRHFSGNDFN